MLVEKKILETSLLHYPDRINRAISIHFCTRSGSYLLGSLFDYHSEVIGLPPYNFSFVFKVLYSLLKNSSHLPILFIINTIIESCPFLFSKWGESREDRLFGLFYKFVPPGNKMGTDVKGFRKKMEQSLASLKERGKLSFVNILKSIFVSYSFSKKGPLKTQNPILIFQFHETKNSQLRWMELSFKEYWALICIRHPIDGLSSHFEHILFEQKMGSADTFSSLISYFIYIANSKKTKNVIGVRFEDIHRDTESTMKKLASLIGIKWDPILVRSTIDGLTWCWQKNYHVMIGTNPKIGLLSTTKKMNSFDKWRLSLAFEPYLKKWGYPIKKTFIFRRIIYFLLKLPFKQVIKMIQFVFTDKSLRIKYSLIYNETYKIAEALKKIEPSRIINYLVVSDK